MKKTKKISCTAVLCVILGGFIIMSQHNPSQAQGSALLNATEAKELIDNGEGGYGPTILDVRTPEEYESGHIPGACLVDFNSPDFAAQVEKLPKNDRYLLYCRSGKRSAKAATLMHEKGFSDVTDMNGGLEAWKEEGFALEKGEPDAD